MTLYVDELVDWGKKGKWCHLMTDQDILAELHAMASKLNLRSYFQDHPLHPHYDLRPGKRERAIELGAVPVSGTELVRRCSNLYKNKEKAGVKSN